MRMPPPPPHPCVLRVCNRLGQGGSRCYRLDAAVRRNDPSECPRNRTSSAWPTPRPWKRCSHASSFSAAAAATLAMTTAVVAAALEVEAMVAVEEGFRKEGPTGVGRQVSLGEKRHCGRNY